MSLVFTSYKQNASLRGRVNCPNHTAGEGTLFPTQTCPDMMDIWELLARISLGRDAHPLVLGSYSGCGWSSRGGQAHGQAWDWPLTPDPCSLGVTVEGRHSRRCRDKRCPPGASFRRDSRAGHQGDGATEHVARWVQGLGAGEPRWSRPARGSLEALASGG